MLPALLLLVALFTAGLTVLGFRELGKPAEPISLGDVVVSTACNAIVIAIVVAAALELS